jgi:amidase
MQCDEAMGRFDVLITPAAPGEAPAGLASTGSAIFNAIWSVLGTPAVTLPLFRGPQGLPVGLQVVAARYKDRQLFNVAEALMRALA